MAELVDASDNLIKKTDPTAQGLNPEYKIKPKNRNPFYAPKSDTTVTWKSLVDTNPSDTGS